jgi:serine/threonine-protein kinase
MTQTSAVIGTAQYLSPEQARGEAVDARSDVYAAGCVLFELLIGHPPFVGDSPVSVAYQHVREDPRTPSDVNPEVPPDLDAIVLKALAKNPLNRYQSAQEMRADALRAVSGRPVMATPVMSEAETMAMAGAAQRPPAGGTRPIPATMGPRQPERTSSWVMAALAALGVLAAIALGVGLYLMNRDEPKVTAQTTEMPELVGKTREDAEKQLQQLGLTGIRAGDPITNADCDKGKVDRQSIAEGTKIELAQAGTFQVCAGPGRVEVPQNLIGGPYENARKTLEDAGLVPVREERDSEKRENDVLELKPAGGTEVEKGTKVTVFVSAGNLVQVPNVSGESVDEARATLTQAGFQVRIVAGSQVLANDEPEVQSQDPRAGTNRKRGSTVELEVTVPAQPTTPPTGQGSPSPSGSGAPPPSGAAGGDDGGGGDGGSVEGSSRGLLEDLFD